MSLHQHSLDLLVPLFSDDHCSSQEAIFRVVAAVLHLGNIEFSKGNDIDSSVVKDEKSRFHLQMTAELLMYALLFPPPVAVYIVS